MPRDKRSFFERITGTISVSDDRDLEEVEVSKPISHEDHVGPATSTSSSWAEEEEEGELAVDVYQTDENIVINSMVAGVKPEDLHINITREMVTIKGRRERPDDLGADEDYFQKELYWGSFARTILLPAEIETEEAQAVEKHGLLTITLPKIDKDKSAKLKVKSVS